MSKIAALVAVVLCVCLAGVWFLANRALNNQVHDFTSRLDMVKLSYSSLNTSLFLRQAVFSDVRVVFNQGAEIQAQRIIVQNLKIRDGKILRLTIRGHGLNLEKFYPDISLHRDIIRSGSELSDVRFLLEYEFSADERQVRIVPVAIRQDNALSICAELVLWNIDPQSMLHQQNPFLLMASALGIRVGSIRAGYVDHSLVMRLAELRRSDSADLPALMHPGSETDFADENRTAIESLEKVLERAFSQGQPLSIELLPAEPVPVSAILTAQSLEHILGLLQVSMHNNPPDFCILDAW